MLKGETLLDGLERTGHEVEYQCRSGYCGMCRLTLLDGSVTYAEPPGLCRPVGNPAMLLHRNRADTHRMPCGTPG